MPRRIGIGIIGYGRFADKWVRSAISKSRLARLVAVQTLTRTVHIPGVSVYSDVRDILADPHVEAVYVTSPNAFHEEHARLALEAGKHVLCEKPMAITAAQCRRMIEVARRQRRYLAAGHMLRFSPALQRAKNIVQNNGLGRFLYARTAFSYRIGSVPRSWAQNKSIAGGGVLLDGGIHCIDSLRYVISQEPSSVADSFLYPSLRRQIEKSATCLLKFGPEGIACLNTHSDAPYGSSLEIVGHRGRLQLDGFVRCRGKILLVHETEDKGRTVTKRYWIDVSRVYENQIDAFCLALRKHPRDMGNAQNGLRNIQIIESIYATKD